METRNFGRLAREHRERLGLTIAQTAERYDLSDRGDEEIELGGSDPKLSNVVKIAAALQIDMGELNVLVLRLV